MTLTLNLQGQIRNLLYLSQKWSDCHKAKKKHIDRTQALKCGHRVWPWPWPWPRIFKVQHGICYISTKSGPKVRCKDLPDSDWGDFRCRRAVDSSNFCWECLEKTDRVITAPHCTVYYKKMFTPSRFAAFAVFGTSLPISDRVTPLSLCQPYNSSNPMRRCVNEWY